MSKLTSMPNIGKEMASKLTTIGIDSPEKLLSLGAKRTFLRLKEGYPSICLVHLYALEGAIQHIPLSMLSEETKKELKTFHQQINGKKKDEPEKYELKFMYDWGSGVCVWATNAASKAKFQDYPVNTSDLPISPELADLLNRLIIQHDTALNWADPGSALLWNEAQQAAFIAQAQSAYQRLCAELGSDYEVSFFPHVF